MRVRYHSLLQATVALARRVDRAEIDFCALAGPLGGASPAQSIEAGGGRGLYGAPGSPLNKVLGLGLCAETTDADLDAVESFYAQRGAPVQIELCPLADPTLPARLCARGYLVQSFENELARTVDDGLPGAPAPEGVRVEAIGAADGDQWIEIIARGFAAPEVAPGAPPSAEPETAAIDAISAVMRQFTHPMMTLYLAWIDGKPAGGGAAWLHDGVLGICGTATLPEFRRRGVQTAINQIALADGRGAADLAIATTAPGSLSQRNFERMGFQVLYTRAIFVKSP